MYKLPVLSEIKCSGDLLYRSHKSQARLESKPYTAEDCLKTEGAEYDWPGDWIGRAMLGNALISLATGSKSAFLGSLYETLGTILNEKGYLGKIYPEGVVDEQQLSGHNWLLRALLEMSRQGFEGTFETAERIVKNLYLPVQDYYACYPEKPEQRVFKGEKAGTLTGKTINHWMVSSDTGCAFMCLDGLAEYYLMTGSREVGQMLDKMCDKFMSIDFTGIQMQTHASLSAVRGILKYYKKTKKQKLLKFAIYFADLYLDFGATANYANYNWFMRPAWTEPCAIVDSFIVFRDLFLLTEETKYLKIARRIYFNALKFSQRDNGGFGTDKCADSQQPILRPDGPSDKLNEAYWCCSMRGGEGLARVCESTFILDGKGEKLFITGLSEGELISKNEKITYLEKDSGYARADRRIGFNKNKNSKVKTICIYVPCDAENISVKICGEDAKATFSDSIVAIDVGNRTDGLIALTYDLKVKTEKAIGKLREKQGFVCMLGDVITGLPEEESADYKGVPDFEINRDGLIRDRKTGVMAEFPGKNADARKDDVLKNQSLRIVFFYDS